MRREREKNINENYRIWDSDKNGLRVESGTIILR